MSEREVQSSNNSLPGDFFPSHHWGEGGRKPPLSRWVETAISKMDILAGSPKTGPGAMTRGVQGLHELWLTWSVSWDPLPRHTATASKFTFFLNSKLVPAVPSPRATGAAVTSLNRAEILRLRQQCLRALETQVLGHCVFIHVVGGGVGRSAQVRSTGREGCACDALPAAIRFLCFNSRLRRWQECKSPLPAAAGLLGAMQRYGTQRMRICPATGLHLECLILAPH